MKTAMQELIDKLVNLSNATYLNGKRSECDIIDKIKDIARNEFLKLEKQQIINSYKAGELNIDFKALHGQGKLSDANKYFSNTYEQ